ncbi:MAG: hypothetical protein ABR888_08435 [Thermoplasmata archaeon]|jgi:hypothetical protein
MVKDEMSLGVQFVRAFRWYVVGVASTLLGLLVLSILGQVSGTVVFYLTEVVAALAIVFLVAVWKTKAWPGRERQSDQPTPNP